MDGGRNASEEGSGCNPSKLAHYLYVDYIYLSNRW